MVVKRFRGRAACALATTAVCLGLSAGVAQASSGGGPTGGCSPWTTNPGWTLWIRECDYINYPGTIYAYHVGETQVLNLSTAAAPVLLMQVEIWSSPDTGASGRDCPNVVVAADAIATCATSAASGTGFDHVAGDFVVPDHSYAGDSYYG